MQHGDAHARLAGEGVDRRGSSVARGGADDRHSLAAPCQHLVEHRREELHREVLEGQGRPVEQLEQPIVALEVAQGCRGGVAETGVGRAGEAIELAAVEASFGEGCEDRGGQCRIVERLQLGQTCKTGNESGTNRPPSSARPASSTSSKLRRPARPRVLT